MLIQSQVVALASPTIAAKFAPRPVFKPRTRLGRQPTEWWASSVISAIGKKAKVKVDSRAKGGKPIVKFASAHDLRRSFGARWSSCVMPQVLMELMRHESIDTTLKFYVGRNAETTADVLWAAHERAETGNTFGNSAPIGPGKVADASDASPTEDASSKMRLLGLEPRTYGLKVRCSTD